MGNESLAVNISEAFEKMTPIIEAFEKAGRDAVIHHQMTGVPLVYWRDGKVVHVDPFSGEEVDPNDPAVIAKIRPVPYHVHAL